MAVSYFIAADQTSGRRGIIAAALERGAFGNDRSDGGDTDALAKIAERLQAALPWFYAR